MIPLTRCGDSAGRNSLYQRWKVCGGKPGYGYQNSPETVAATPEADTATELQISEGREPVVERLGISWNNTEDTFTISTSKVSSGLQLTNEMF